MFEHLTLSNLDSFLAVIVSVGGLYKAGASFRRNEFDEVVDPLFQATTKAVDDYIAMFSATVDAVEDTRNLTGLEDALSQLRKHRTKMVTTRSRVGEISREIRENGNDKRVSAFVEKIEAIFAADGSSSDKKRMTRSLYIVDRLERAIAGELRREVIVTTLRTTLSEIEEAYTALAQSYARLRIRENKKRAADSLKIVLS